MQFGIIFLEKNSFQIIYDDQVRCQQNFERTPAKQSVSMATGNLRTTADTPEEIADIFNTYFTSVFSVPQEDKVGNGAGKFPAAEAPFTNIVLNVGEVEAVLNSLDPNKATGPDEIPARILKETATTITPSLCKLFNRSLGKATYRLSENWPMLCLSIRRMKKIMLKTIGLSPYFAFFPKFSNVVS